MAVITEEIHKKKNLEKLTYIFSEKIYVNGCMTEARTALFKHVMPLLLICALVSLVVGLIELLLLLCAVCFADHIKVNFAKFYLYKTAHCLKIRQKSLILGEQSEHISSNDFCHCQLFQNETFFLLFQTV